jgi:ribosome maturation factor RimP
VHEPEVGAGPPFACRGMIGVVETEALVRPVVERAGLELVDVTFRGDRGHRVLHVTIDRDGGVDLDTIAVVSEKLARRLDLEGFGEGSYQLEVSSPGLERSLKTPGQFARAIGERVEARTSASVADATQHVGILRVVDDAGFDLDVDGHVRRIAFVQVASARTVVDWAEELKGAGR